MGMGGKTNVNMRFANDIDALTEEEHELEALIQILDKTCTIYEMKISAEKTRLIMENRTNDIQMDIKIKGQAWNGYKPQVP